MGGEGGGRLPHKAENRASAVLGSQVQLDGAWSFQAQFNALGACNVKDDTSFRESSVKDVTDRMRDACATRLQGALAEAAEKEPTMLFDKPGKLVRQAERDPLVEAEVRREVRDHVKRLQRLRQDGSAQHGATDSLRALQELDISVTCLKATKVAAELNLPFWRGEMASAEVHDLANGLVRRWRVMYRAEAGKGPTPEEVRRRCRSAAMDLEGIIYGKHQRVRSYSQMIEAIVLLLGQGTKATRGLLGGSMAAEDLVDRAARHL